MVVVSNNVVSFNDKMSLSVLSKNNNKITKISSKHKQLSTLVDIYKYRNQYFDTLYL